jgi:hypothetical protein
MRYLLHRGCAFSGTGIATVQNLLKQGKEIDHRLRSRIRVLSRDEEMGTGWFFNRYKASLDIFWLRDESLEESASFAISLRKSSTTSKPPWWTSACYAFGSR